MGNRIRHRDGCLGVNDIRMYWQAWLPAREPRAAIVLAHGGGEHSGRYTNVVERLLPLGYAVYAPDHRGHGRSGGRRATVDHFSQYTDDLDRFVDFVRKQQPDLSVVLLGHSLGAAISLAYALDHQDKLDGLILSGPPAVIANDVSRLQLAAGSAMSRIAPRLPVLKLDSTKVARDPEVVKAYDRDPLVFHGRLDARMLGELLSTVQSFRGRVRELRLPVLCLHGSRDQLADPAGSRMICQQAASTDKTLHVYDGAYHEVFNDFGHEQVLGDVAAWLTERFGAP